MLRSLYVFGLVLCVGCATGEDNPGDDDDDMGAPDAGAKTETNCTDKIDDDGDGLTDCEDDDCEGLAVCMPEFICDNGFDDDQDGLADCGDEDCDGIDGCEHGAEVSCDDGRDNDGDTWNDCADPDCVGAANCNPEMNCTDGEDDDGDGNIDCRDVDCDGVGFCEFAGEMSCQDGEDNDGDGMTDCDDSSCAGGIACLLGCPDGSDPVTYAATDVPVAITDNNVSTSSIAVAGDGIVTLAALQVNVVHTYTGDLTLTLIGPAGRRILLADRIGSGGDNYTDTVFADGAATSITAGSPPFSGAYAPEEPLDVLIGGAEAGTWSFEVSDQAGGDTGTIQSVQLQLCVCTDCEVGAACQDGLDNDGDSDVDCDDSDCAGIIQCTPETVCDDGLDDDQDGDIDCEDVECDGVGTCEHGTELTCDDAADNDADGDTDCGDSDCSGTVLCMAEVDCTDGIDNDMDGATDCDDPGCATDPSCGVIQADETMCSDGFDNDNDGMTDCAEPGCALACAIAACGGGEEAIGAAATDLPQAITDNATFTSVIGLAGDGTVTRVAVRFSAMHTWAADLDVTLRSPTGTAVELTSDNGSLDDNYTDTIFLDAAATSIVDGTAPFTGEFQPEQPLSAFDGEAWTGDWSLDVHDDAAGDQGSFTDFDLALCVSP